MIERIQINKKRLIRLISFFLRSYRRDLRTIISIILSIIAPIYLINIIVNLSDSIIINQEFVDNYLFWGSFITYSIIIFRFISIIITSDIISGDFSHKRAMILYTLPISRGEIIFSKAITMMIYLFILQSLTLIISSLILWIMLGLIVSFNVFLLGLLISYLSALFYFSLTLLLSGTTRNTIVSALIPLIYVYIGPQIFSIFDLNQLSYVFHENNGRILLQYFIYGDFTGLNIEQISSFIILCVLPIIIIIITIFFFKQIDIRI